MTYHALALTKLRMYGGAADALRAAGDPDAAPNLGPDGRSLAPFALRWLQARPAPRCSGCDLRAGALTRCVLT